MAYISQTFEDGEVLYASELNAMDAGIVEAQDANTQNATAISQNAEAIEQNTAAIERNTSENAVQYDPDNPPPYPVTSVNSKTGAVVIDVPTELSELSGDPTHRVVTDAQIADWNAKSDFSGNYNDLTNKPTIPTVPVQSVNGKTGAVTLTAADVDALPDTTEIPTKLSELTADATHRTVTDTQIATWNGKSDFSGSYNDLTNKPTIPVVPVQSVNGKTGAVVLTAADVNALPDTTEIPTKLSELATDATHRVVTDTQITAWNGKSNFSGNYNDLTNKPTIPTVPVQSVNNMTGAVVLSAMDVGARPNTWTPSASDVGAVPTTRTVNGKALSSNITLTAVDVSAVPISYTLTMVGVDANGVEHTYTIYGLQGGDADDPE